jgi:hypothetical protein
LEREGFGEEDGGSPDEDPNSILLPWEMKTSHDEDNLSVFVTDEELMEDILALSRHEKTFLEPFNSCEAGDHIASDKPDFVLDESRISLIRRLLDIDESLAVMHARMSGEFSGFSSDPVQLKFFNLLFLLQVAAILGKHCFGRIIFSIVHSCEIVERVWKLHL